MSDVEAIPKKRGRAPKKSDTSPAKESKDAKAVKDQEKEAKKRARDPTPEKETSNGEVSPPKRGRGRPAKGGAQKKAVPSPAKLTSKGGKRGRGRPPKTKKSTQR